MAQKKTKSIAVLGAGPVGLETALHGIALGYDVTLFERGRVADNIRRWGHVRLFTPWSYNCSPLGRRRLTEAGCPPPDSESDCPTGTELVERYLAPLARLPEMQGAIRQECEVLACGRETIAKHHLIASRRRSDFPFRILIRTSGGGEEIHRADAVIDATGVYGNHNCLGEGGIPALGEGALSRGIHYDIPDVLGDARATFEGRRTLIVGSGYSSATTAVALGELQSRSASTEVVWVCREDRSAPISEVPGETLSERATLTRRANELAAAGREGFEHRSGCHVRSVARNGRGYVVGLSDRAGGGEAEIRCDEIVANVGYHPDASIYRQLQVHECYATLGPIKLAASLLAQDAADCLAIESGGAETLKNPEPDFHILGAKSFGTNSSFLMRLGHEQVDAVYQLISGRPETELSAP